VRRHRPDRRHGAVDRSVARGGGHAGVLGAQYLAILLGATGGFLVYNLHPASIFMGDSGSLLLGFSFAAVTLSTGRQVPGRSDILSIVAVPALVLLIPIFDTTLVTLSRWVSGRRASEGGRDHSSHRLVAIGLSERRAVMLLWFLAAVGGSLGVTIDYFQQSYSAMAAALAFLLGMILFAAYLAGIRVYDNTDSRVKQGRSRRLSSSSCTSGALPRCSSTSASPRSATTRRTACASRIRRSS
jgi:UDP-GlcNAc:undecaprenyl-phosphate GlcNAc-1-phosphate transferase